MIQTANARPRRRWSLRRQLALGVMAYVSLLTLGVMANDFIVNESAENLVWETLLQSELDHFLELKKANPEYHLAPTETLEMFELRTTATARPDLQTLSPGIHDEIDVDGRERVVLVRDFDQTRYVLALDIRDMESRETRIRGTVFLSAIVSTILLGFLGAWGAARLTRPLAELAGRIRALNPEQGAQTVPLPENASAELAVIVDALNNHGERLEAFIEREREFVATVSHELRTPLSIVQGAVDLTLAEDRLPDSARQLMQRVRATLDDVDEMVATLLALAKNPERLIEISEPIPLHLLVPEIVEQYRPLATGKGVTFRIGEIVDATILAPPQMVQSAIGNLLRNAIENTYAGEVVIHMEGTAAVIIENRSQELDVAELARTYTRLARGGGRDGGGVGLTLITRLCKHCGWSLSLKTDRDTDVRFCIDFLPAASMP